MQMPVVTEQTTTTLVYVTTLRICMSMQLSPSTRFIISEITTIQYSWGYSTVLGYSTVQYPEDPYYEAEPHFNLKLFGHGESKRVTPTNQYLGVLHYPGILHCPGTLLNPRTRTTTSAPTMMATTADTLRVWLEPRSTH